MLQREHRVELLLNRPQLPGGHFSIVAETSVGFQPSSMGPITLLLLEDEAEHIEMLRQFLELSGQYRLEAVTHIADLWPRLAAQTYDALLLDYSLPDGNGLEVLRDLQTRQFDIPVIMVTGRGDERLAAQAIQNGAAEYVVKSREYPASLPEILERVIALARQKRALAAAEIARRRRTSEALEESEARYRSLIDISPDAILLTDLNGRILVCNQQAARMYGCSDAGELLDTDFLDYVVPEDRKRAADDRQLAIEHGCLHNAEYTLMRMDETTFCIELNTSVVTDSDGRPKALLSVARDVTERRQHEREREAIISFTTALRSAVGRLELMTVILDQLSTLLRADSAGLVTRDVTTGEQVIELGYGAAAELAGRRLPAGAGLCGQVMISGQPYRSNHLQSHAMSRTYADLPAAVQAVMCIPLTSQEQMLAAVWVGRRQTSTPFNSDDLRLLIALGDIAANALYRATINDQTEQRLQRLAVLRTIDMAITASLDLRVTLNILLDQAAAQLHLEAVHILLLNPNTQMLEYAVGHGLHPPAAPYIRLRLGEGCAGQAALERRTICLRNAAEAADRLPYLLLPSPNSRQLTYYALPLVAKGQVRGVLEACHDAQLNPDPEWPDFLETIAGQAAIAIDNASLFDDLQRANVELNLAYDMTLDGWSRTIDLRAQEADGHSRRVAEMSLRLARLLGVPEAEQVHIRRGALLHDIGKIAIPDTILFKPGPLNDDEWDLMRKHPIYAYEMLAVIPSLRPALDIPYAHHESWDGSGYPRGLKGRAIPLAARIFSVADVWDVLCSPRPYRPPWTIDKAREYIRRHAGIIFDPKVVEAFEDLCQHDTPPAANTGAASLNPGWRPIH